ncbi:hypothetical protein AK812_SmicGene47876, partial [Symbiodinium microadriaticum]
AWTTGWPTCAKCLRIWCCRPVMPSDWMCAT